MKAADHIPAQNEAFAVPDPLPMVELTGSPREMGLAHGQALRATIQRLIDEHDRRLNEFALDRTGSGLSKDFHAKVVAGYLPPATAYSAELVAELHGIAEGASVPFERIFTLNCFLDVYDVVFPGISAQIMAGCTAYGVTAATSGEGVSFVAQNLDLRAFFGPAAALLKVQPLDAPAALVVTLAGVVGCAGINSLGVALTFNKLAPTDSGPGVPFPFLARSVLGQKRAGDAIHAIGRHRRGSGSHVLIGDKDGDVFGVEATGADYEVLYAESGVIAHSNHYIAPRLQPLDREYKLFAGDTYVRLRQASVCLHPRSSGVTLDQLFSVARDHTNYPDSICRHPNQESPYFSQAQTIVSLIAVPKRNELHVASGPPCEREFRTYKI